MFSDACLTVLIAVMFTMERNTRWKTSLIFIDTGVIKYITTHMLFSCIFLRNSFTYTIGENEILFKYFLDVIALYLLTEEMSYILLHENSQVQNYVPSIPP